MAAEIINYLTNDLKVIKGLSFFGILIAISVYLSQLIVKQFFNQRMADHQKKYQRNGGLSKRNIRRSRKSKI
ncbi:hypothetical protein Q5O89_15725 [Peribacillus frigoritolerans]|nr:hypothetical protein [Peribacillus frigoritolerans]